MRVMKRKDGKYFLTVPKEIGEVLYKNGKLIAQYDNETETLTYIPLVINKNKNLLQELMKVDKEIDNWDKRMTEKLLKKLGFKK